MSRPVMAAGLLVCSAAIPGCGVAVGEPPTADLSHVDPAAAELIVQLDAAARRNPRQAESRASLGMAYEVHGLSEAALRCYVQAESLEPSEPRWSYYAAYAHAQLGDLEGALAAIDRSLALDGAYAPAHLWRGEWLLDSGRLEQARASYERGTTLEPDNPAGWVGLGRALLESGDPGGAVTALEPIARAHPDLPHVHHVLGLAYRALGEADRSRRALARGRPGPRPLRWPDPRHEAKRSYLRGYGALMREVPALLDSRRFEMAIGLMEPLLEEHPGDLALLNNLSVAYRGAGRKDDALVLLRQGLEHDPGAYPLHMAIAAEYERRGRLSEVHRHLQRAMALDPRAAEPHARWGRILSARGRYREALAACESALDLDPQHPAALMFAALAEEQLGRRENAIGRLERAVSLHPALTLAYLKLTELRMQSGDLDGARAALAEAMALEPRHPAAAALERRLARARAARR